MYKVLKIHKHTATSFIDLLNIDTGTQDKCFDDSSVVSLKNFAFIKEGGVYDCKMELFGEFTNQKTDSSVEVTIVETNVIIGKTKYLKALIGSDVYYILESDTKGLKLKRIMNYIFSRKDLIQVDDVVHADCL